MNTAIDSVENNYFTENNNGFTETINYTSDILNLEFRMQEILLQVIKTMIFNLKNQNYSNIISFFLQTITKSVWDLISELGS